MSRGYLRHIQAPEDEGGFGSNPSGRLVLPGDTG